MYVSAYCTLYGKTFTVVHKTHFSLENFCGASGPCHYVLYTASDSRGKLSRLAKNPESFPSRKFCHIRYNHSTTTLKHNIQTYTHSYTHMYIRTYIMNRHITSTTHTHTVQIHTQYYVPSSGQLAAAIVKLLQSTKEEK